MVNNSSLNSSHERRVAWRSPLLFLSTSALPKLPSKLPRNPVIFRFDTDDFMTEALALVNAGGAGLAGKIAYAETWKGPIIDSPTQNPIKLYLPAHKRFYLVAASLVRKEIGYPDHSLDVKRHETARFVFRKVAPVAAGKAVSINDPASFNEFAWSPEKAAWSFVDNAYNVDADEETFPLHAYATGGQCQRTVFMGYVPLAAREGAVTPLDEKPPIVPGTDNDPRRILWRVQVVQSLIDLYNQAGADANNTDDPPLREALFFLLADIAAFFKKYNVDQNSLSLALNTFFHKGGTWLNALSSITPDYDENNEISTTWYDKIINGTIDILKSCVAGMTSSDIQAAIDPFMDRDSNGKILQAQNLSIYKKLKLPELNQAQPSSQPQPSMATLGSLYILRCVYDHPLCRDPLLPGKPLHPPFVSEPTEPFKIAYFFDADAPQRPVKILMPIDTSIAGLKKLPQNVKVLISQQLANQMERIKGVKIKDLEEGNLGAEGGFDVGMICSFSIQIVFIIALVLLFMFAIILNLVFWWMPFFKICLPIPILKKGKD
jgi:hypothetical protein